MSLSLATTTFLVNGYDEAIRFFTTALRFQLLEDVPQGDGKRWVRVGGDGADGASLLLALATTSAQQRAVGQQAGDRVFLFLHTSDFKTQHAHMLAQGVRFAETPRHEAYGTVAVFSDLYGNKWDLIERAKT